MLCTIAVLLVIGWMHTAADDALLFMELPATVLPFDVWANGFGIVGTLSSGGGFYWMPTAGARPIGGLSARAVSRNGLTIVGRALDARRLENAAIWNGGTERRVLGSFEPDSQPCDRLLSSALGVSDDGRVIVGLGWDGCEYAHASRWDESTGIVDLGSIDANATGANNVSGDGKIIVGWQEDVTGFREGAKWVNRREELIRGPHGTVGEAFAANRDGSVIVGGNCDPANRGSATAWSWTPGKGVECFPIDRPATLPALPYTASMLATSDDGHVIGGAFSSGLDSEAVIWLDRQPYFLKDYLRSHGYPEAFRGWVNTGFVTGVAADGRTIVGYGAGAAEFQGFRVVLPKRESK
jgi:probable HAF family extracellular repeat protein